MNHLWLWLHRATWSCVKSCTCKTITAKFTLMTVPQKMRNMYFAQCSVRTLLSKTDRLVYNSYKKSQSITFKFSFCNAESVLRPFFPFNLSDCLLLLVIDIDAHLWGNFQNCQLLNRTRYNSKKNLKYLVHWNMELKEI